MKKKIICSVTNDLNSDRRMIRICSALSENNYDVQLVGREQKKSAHIISQKFAQHRFKLWFNSGKLFYLNYNARVFFWLLFQKFEALYAVDLDTLGACALAISFKKTFTHTHPKLIFDAHELYTDTPEVFNRPLIRKIWLAVEKFGVPKTDVRFTVSATIAEELFHRYGKNFEVVRNAPPLNFYKNNENNLQPRFDKKTLIYVGNLNIGRGLETAIDALPFLPGYKLEIIGDGVLMEPLKTLATKLKVAERVIFYGHKNPDVIPEILQRATFGLHISENMGRSYELSLANKFFDYIHAGLPVIFTEFVEYKTINTEFNIGVMIEKTDVQQLVRVILNFENNFKAWDVLVQNCYSAREVLNWEEEEKTLINALNFSPQNAQNSTKG